MMTGNVIALHALLAVTVILDDGRKIALEFVIDTGFTGDLVLPAEAIAQLGLPAIGNIAANLANDFEVDLRVHLARILWNGNVMKARVLAAGKRPLLGTGLLQGCELLAQFAESGLVTVEPL